MYSTCEATHQPFGYEPLDANGDKQAWVNEDEKSYNELITKGSVSYVEFSTYSNYYYPGIDIYFYTLQKHKFLNIHSFEFEFDGNKKNIKINKRIKLNKYLERSSDKIEEFMFTVEDNDELSVKSYHYYISHYNNKINIDLHQFFNATDKDVGKNIEAAIRMYYSFDDSDILVQENMYLVYIYKRKS